MPPRDSSVQEDSKYSIRAVERAAMVLNSFTRERRRLTLDEVTRMTGLSKPTVFRILSTLQGLKYVMLDPSDGRYRLGSVFLTLAASAIGSLSLSSVVRPHTTILRNRTQATVLVGALMDDLLVYVDKREAPGPVRIAADIGWRRDPPTFGMLGMTLMAHLEKGEIIRLLKEKPPLPHTQASITDPAAFIERLERIRGAGLVVECEEAIPGVWGVAAPIFDSTREVVAAVGVALPMTLKSDEKTAEISEGVLECARRISADLGYT